MKLRRKYQAAINERNTRGEVFVFVPTRNKKSSAQTYAVKGRRYFTRRLAR